MSEPIYEAGGVTVYQEDCLEVMPWLVENGMVFDLCLTDPPYGIGINKKEKNMGPRRKQAARQRKKHGIRQHH